MTKIMISYTAHYIYIGFINQQGEKAPVPFGILDLFRFFRDGETESCIFLLTHFLRKKIHLRWEENYVRWEMTTYWQSRTPHW